MILSPKARFLKKAEEAKHHQSLVQSDSFQNALTVALAEMQMNLPKGDNPAKSWDAHSRMVGAREFIHTLLNLAEVAPVVDKPNQSLNYEA
jgi:hypothetical protein